MKTPFARPAARRAGLLLLAFLGARSVGAAPPPRLGDAVAPRAQGLVLRLDPRLAEYSGSTTLDLEVLRPTDGIRLHAGVALGKVELRDAAGRRHAVVAERAADLVNLRAEDTLAPGRYRLAIDFTQSYATRPAGLYVVSRGPDRYLYTQFEQIEARTAFPCFDEPGFKLPWTLTLEVPERDLALANTGIARESVRKGTRTVTFKTTPPLPSYLVALAVGPFDTVPIAGLGVPGRVVTVRGEGSKAALAAAETPALLAALEGYFDRKYPFDKLDLIAVPDFAFGAMENPGAITYAESILLEDPRDATASHREQLVHVTAHELAHMWFGDFVTMKWWNDLWLNESFADWMANKIAAKVAPELGFDVAHAEAADRAMRADTATTATAIRLPDDCSVEDAFAIVLQAYAKGVGVLSMAEAWVGEERFRQGLLGYLAKHAWGSADANDLWRALGGGEDVVGVLAGFVEQAGVPRLDMTLAAGKVTVREERFHRAGEALPAARWRVPVVLAFADDEGRHTVRALVGDGGAEIDLHAKGKVRWLQPNAEASGYYRWTLDPRALERLTAARRELSRAERVALLDDLRALLDAGLLGGAEWVRTLEGFAGDDDPRVATAVVRAAEQLEDPFGGSPAYAAWVRAVFGARAHAAGWAAGQAKPGSEDLRVSVVALVGGPGEDPDLRSQARAFAGRWLAGEPLPVAPELLGTMLGLAARDGDRGLFDRLRERFATATVPQERGALLSALGAFADPTLAAAGLYFALDPSVRSSEVVRVLSAAARDEAGRDRTFAWLQKHWDAVSQKAPPWQQAGLVRLGGGCSAERLAAARAFFHDRQAPGLESSLARTADAVDACVRLRGAQGAAVQAAFGGSAP